MVRVFILNDCIFCADAGIRNEKVQGSRYKVQGKTLNLQSSLLIAQPLRLCCLSKI